MSDVTPQKFKQLVERLTIATEAGRLRWTPGFESNAFVAVLEKGSVRIARHAERWRDDEEIPHLYECYELDIFDKNGVRGERLSSNPQHTGDDSVPFDKKSLAELFRVVRANAVDLEDVVESMLGELV